ncbi:hypothetical protein ACWIGE_14700 [Streptomyces diastaticus]
MPAPQLPTSVDTAFGAMRIDRVTETCTPEPQGNWTATYAVNGARITGIVDVQPQYDGPSEVLPSRFQVRLSEDSREAHPAQFTVNGVSVSPGDILLGIAAPEDVYRYALHRDRKGRRSYDELSDAAHARAHAALQAVLDVHVSDVRLVLEHAGAYADHYLPSRRSALAQDLRNAEEEAAELERQIGVRRRQVGAMSEYRAPLAHAAQHRAERLLQAVLDATAPGHRQITCSVSVAGRVQVAVLHALNQPAVEALPDHEDSSDFALLLACALAMPASGGLVVRSRAEGRPEEVRGWRLREGGAYPLTAAEIFDAYCTDAVTGEPVAPEPGVEYRAAAPLDDGHRPGAGY